MTAPMTELLTHDRTARITGKHGGKPSNGKAALTASCLFPAINYRGTWGSVGRRLMRSLHNRSS
jgi:hypothetical protein